MITNLTNLERTRLEKVERLKGQGIDPYPTQAERTHTSIEAIKALEVVEGVEDAEPIRATLVGRIRSMRPMGRLVFAHIEDGFGRIQLFVRQNEIGDEQLALLNLSTIWEILFRRLVR